MSDLKDHEPIEFAPENHYGCLALKREGGKDFWAVENHDGYHWKPCHPGLAIALRKWGGGK